LVKPPNFVELRSRIRSHLLIRSLLAERAIRGGTPERIRWEPGHRAHLLVALKQGQERLDVAAFLEEAGHEVQVVESLQTVSEQLNEGLPDLLVLDQELSDGTGTAFLAHLRHFARTRDLPVLLCCVRDALATDLQAMEAGPLDFLTRPFEPFEVRLRVSVLLRHGALLKDRGGSHGGGPSLIDPATGTYSEAFLEAHLDLVRAQRRTGGSSLALLAVRVELPRGPVGRVRAQLLEVVRWLNGTLKPGEALGRVAERTFVMVLPGVAPEGLHERLQALRSAAFPCAVTGFIAPPNASATALLRRLSETLQQVSPGSV